LICGQFEKAKRNAKCTGLLMERKVTNDARPSLKARMWSLPVFRFTLKPIIDYEYKHHVSQI